MATSLLTALFIAVVTIQVASATYYPPCDPPSRPDYGGYNPYRTKYPIGSKIKFYCNDGYTLYGSSYTICKYNRRSYWTHPHPVCKPPITCPTLKDLPYGSLKVTGNKPGSTVQYVCEKGYKLVGNAWRKCLYNGYWSGMQPVCKPIPCPHLDDIPYGVVKVNGYNPGHTASYECEKGYKLVGDGLRKCLYTGYWGGKVPVCKPIICLALKNPPYGIVKMTGNKPGSTVHYECEKGYKLVGDASRKCLYTGYWGGKVPVCKPILCHDLDKIPYGIVKVTGNKPGHTASYECEKGYKLVGDASRKCLYTGYWGGKVPVCKPILCRDLDKILYGVVKVTGNKPGYTASYECEKGYKLVGDASRKCLYTGYWGGKVPVCKPILCRDLDKIPYGVVKVTGNKPGHTARYECEKGYKLVGDASRKCLYTGYWGGKVPVCKPIICHDLDDVPYGIVKVTGNKPGHTASYECEKGYKLVGDASRKCLYTGYWGGKVPVCKPILCRDLDKILYGVVKVTGNKPGHTASYECEKGYKLVGDASRKCLYTGYWGGKVPVCKPILCRDLDKIPYGVVKVTGNKPGHTARYECEKGYKLVGDASRKCLYTGYWGGKVPVCKPIICHDLDDVPYGIVKVTGNKPGHTASYECEKGYKLVGDASRKCLYTGYWGGKVPVCKPILCHDLDKIPYGVVKVTGNKPGHTASYECEKGYKLVGDASRKCLYTGYWGGKVPVCKPILCRDLDKIPYGVVKVTGNKPGHTASYECEKGYKLVGDASRKCLYTGYWGGKVPVCKPILCRDLDKIPYGVVKVTGNKPGHTARYECEKGYKLVGDASRKCLYTGYWGGKVPVCKPIICHDLDDVPYGIVKVTGNKPGHTASYECEKGYKLVGDASRKCLYTGYWGGKVPVCKPILCHDLDKIPYGVVKVTGNKPGHTASYECEKGYKLVGDASRKCLYTGYWGGKVPVCKPILCRDLDKIPYGVVKVTGNKPGHTASYECEKGYKLVGDASRKCLYTGYWGGKVPVCKPILCRDLDKIPYGVVKVTGNKPGHTARYECEKGYKLVGDASRKCLYTGYWGGKVPVCKPIICHDLDDVPYGIVKVTGNKPGHTASYECEKGYKLVGDASRKCLYTGYWGGKVPVCKPILCHDLDKIPYGVVKVTGNKPGHTASYECEKGYKLVGDASRKCLYTGYWGGKVPVCKPILCHDLDKILYGVVKVTGNKPGHTASYECEKGYKLVGDASRKCLYTGYWGGKVPVCKPILCPNLDDPPYGSVKVTSNKAGSVAYYKCNQYHKLIGDASRKCLYTGYWGGKEPVCKKIVCPHPKPITYGSIRVDGYHPTSKVYYSCNKGYEVYGVASRKCLDDGSWYGKAPICRKKIVCPHLVPPKYGKVRVEGYGPSSKAYYTCDEGYERHGLESRACLDDGSWYGKCPVCRKKIVCPDLDHPQYGKVNVGGYSPSSRAHYVCDDGYDRYGLEYRKCLSDGSWYGKAPICRKKILCSHLDHPQYGKVKVSTYTPYSKAYYTCDEGYIRYGLAYRKCLSDGSWYGKAPVCRKKILCSHLDHPQYGKVKVSTYTPYSKAYYTCDEGYIRYGLAYRKCLSDGSWYGKAPVCRKKIVCPDLDHPQYGEVKVSGYTPLSRAYYTCDDGYDRHGLAYRKCLSDGSWYGKAPICRKKIVCPDLDHPQYGEVKVSGYTPLSRAYYTCDDGYDRHGLAYRKCLSDGSWYGSAPTCHPVKY